MEERVERERPLVLMLGTDVETRGGISAVIRSYLDSGLTEHYRIEHVATHIDTSRGDKLRIFLKALWRVLRVRRGETALAHIHFASRASFYRKSILWMILRAKGVKVIYHLHGGGFVDFHDNAPAPVRRLIRLVLEGSSHVIVLSPQWRAILQERFRIPGITVLRNPLSDSGLFELERHDQGPRLLFLGLITRPKGLYDLLEVVARLKSRFPGIHLDIGGAGDESSLARELKRLGIEENVSFHGWVDMAKKRELFSVARVYVLPSYFEGVPVSIVEAMAASVPVVASRAGGIPDLVSSDFGLLMDAGDLDALEAALETLLSDPDLNREMGERGREEAWRNYQPEQVVKQLRKIYEEILSSSSTK